MADIFSKAKRSEIMSRIKSHGTSPELQMVSLIRPLLTARSSVLLNCRNLPGQPDIVIPAMRLAIFVDGCFYHGCPKHGHQPKSNQGYWGPKLARNMKRDASSRRRLRRLGFSVWRFWEHELRPKALVRTQAVMRRRLLNRRRQVRLLQVHRTPKVPLGIQA